MAAMNSEYKLAALVFRFAYAAIVNLILVIKGSPTHSPATAFNEANRFLDAADSSGCGFEDMEAAEAAMEAERGK